MVGGHLRARWTGIPRGRATAAPRGISGAAAKIGPAGLRSVLSAAGAVHRRIEVVRRPRAFMITRPGSPDDPRPGRHRLVAALELILLLAAVCALVGGALWWMGTHLPIHH